MKGENFREFINRVVFVKQYYTHNNFIHAKQCHTGKNCTHAK